MRFVSSLVYLFSFISIFGQSAEKNHHTQYFENRLIEFNDKNLSQRDFQESYQELLGLSQHDMLLPTERTFEVGEYKHVEHQQWYKGVEVLGGKYILHFKADQLVRSSGAVFTGIDLDVKDVSGDALDEERILDELRFSMEQRSYPVTNFENCEFRNTKLYILDLSYPEFSGQYTIAKHYQLFSDEDPINEDVYVDLKSGQIINHFSNVHHERVKGVANTHYYGEQEIYIDSVAPDRYLLYDEERSIATLDYSNQRDTFENDSKYWSQFNEHRNEVAGDVHFGASKFHEMMKNRFNWIGLDGMGSELVSRVHAVNKYYVNAYWNGEVASFGNGDCDRYDPLTTLDIVGHEFIHGFTDYTSDLIYANESGALNEAISDIFGKALEFYYDPDHFNWYLGDRIRKSEDARIFRSMSDPHERFHPKMYGGVYWYRGEFDNGGVHYNSGVLNHWFYLLVEGGEGHNEHNMEYDVNPIGMDTALDIVFGIQTAYLTTNSQYRDAYLYSLIYCADHYGEQSDEYKAVKEAWTAVGLFEGFDHYDLSISKYADEGVISFCVDSLYQPNFRIRNESHESFPAGTPVQVSYYQGSQLVYTDTLIMETDLLPGAERTYSPERPLTNDMIQTGKLELRIEIEEEIVTTNNQIYLDVHKSLSSTRDLELVRAEFSSSGQCSSGELSSFIIAVRNSGCQTIADNELIGFDVDTDLGEFSLEFPVYSSIRPGSIRSFTYREVFHPELEVIPDSITAYQVELSYYHDTEEYNNIYTNTLDLKSYADKSFYTSFDNSAYQEHMEIVAHDYFMMDSIVEYKDNKMLAISAVNEAGNFRLCEDDEDFIDIFSYEATIELCIDTREMIEPVFSFDLVQFRNEHALHDLPDEMFSNMIRLRTKDPAFEEVLIYGQQEGDIKQHQVDLPLEYFNILYIDVLCVSAKDEHLRHDFLEHADVSLFDDFRIFEKGKALTDFDEKAYLIYPNPADNYIEIFNENQELEFEYALYDMIGQKLMGPIAAKGQSQLELNGLPNGIYTLVINESDGALHSKKVMVNK